VHCFLSSVSKRLYNNSQLLRLVHICNSAGCHIPEYWHRHQQCCEKLILRNMDEVKRFKILNIFLLQSHHKKYIKVSTGGATGNNFCF